MSQRKPLKPYRNRPELPAAGQALISGSAVAPGAAATLAVPFGRTFTSPPLVQLTMANGPGGSAYLVPRAISTTTTGFTLYVYNTGSVAWSWTDLAVNWQARP